MNATRHSPVLIRQIITLAMASTFLLAPAWAILTNPARAAAASTASAEQLPDRHGGPRYWPITGARVGAPSEAEVSTYGGSHKHLWVAQQLYGPGVVVVPGVDSTVHQSR
jgi:hypothetical protein